jgi:transcriptional regulator with XRE-family HTH domain
MPAHKSKGARLLRQWRKRRGLSQPLAAMLLGVDQMTLSRYERGRVAPRAARAADFQRKTEGAVPATAWETEARAS